MREARHTPWSCNGSSARQPTDLTFRTGHSVGCQQSTLAAPRVALLGLLFIVSLASCAHRQNIQKLSDKPTLSLRRLPPTCDTVDRSNEELKIETFSALTAPTGHQDSAAVRPSNHIGPETALRPATSQDIEPSPDGYYLSELIDLGLRYNPSTRVRWAAVRASAAAYEESRGGYYPSVELSGIVANVRTRQTMPKLYETTHLGPSLQLTYLICDFGGRNAEVEAMYRSLMASEGEKNQTAQDVILRVATSYHVLVGTLAGLRAAETSLEEARTSLTAAERRRHNGVGTITDVFLARAQRAEHALEVVERRGKVARARGSLATSIGLPADTELPVAFPTEEPQLQSSQAKVVHDLITEGLKRRPDLYAAWMRQREAEANVRKAQSNRWPTLRVRAGAAYLDPSFGEFGEEPFINRGFEHTAILALRYPLFEGFSLQNAVRRSQAISEQARAHVRGVEEKVMLQIWNSYQDVVTAAERVEANDELLKSAQLSYDAALTAYRAGLNTIVELMQAQAMLAKARHGYVDAHASWYVALAQLARNTGQIRPSDNLPPLNNPPAPHATSPFSPTTISQSVIQPGP